MTAPSRIIEVLILVLLARCAAASAEVDEIRARFSGYILWFPSHRCCAYKLTLFHSGRGQLVVHRNDQVKPTDEILDLSIPLTEMDHIRAAIVENQFHLLPENLPLGPKRLHGLTRKVEIRFGKKIHRVSLYDWPEDTTNESEDVIRMMRVWKAIRIIIRHPDIEGE